VGLLAGAEDLIPPSPPAPRAAEEPPASLLPTPTTRALERIHKDPTENGLPESAVSVAQSTSGADNTEAPPRQVCRTCVRPDLATEDASEERQATEVVEDETAQYAADVPPLQAAPDRTLTVGTRLQAALTHPVITSFAGTPVTATLTHDVVLAGEVVLATGTLIAGESFGTSLDDRAQLVFSAAVHRGRGIHFRGVALGSDSRLGIPGRVVRRASKAKKGVGRVLGSLGSALAVGLARQGSGGVLGDAGLNLASDLAADVTQLDRTWANQRSDKGIEIRAGTEVTVYVQAETTVR
jgi:hypothetical protein